MLGTLLRKSIEIVKTVQTCKITGNLTAKRQEYGSAAKN